MSKQTPRKNKRHDAQCPAIFADRDERNCTCGAYQKAGAPETPIKVGDRLPCEDGKMYEVVRILKKAGVVLLEPVEQEEPKTPLEKLVADHKAGVITDADYCERLLRAAAADVRQYGLLSEEGMAHIVNMERPPQGQRDA